MSREYLCSLEFQQVPACTYTHSPGIPTPACRFLRSYRQVLHRTGIAPVTHNTGPVTQVNTPLCCHDLPVSRYIRSQVRMSERWTHSHRHVPLNPFWNVGLGPPSGSSKGRVLLTDLHGDLCAPVGHPAPVALRSPKRFRCVASFTPSIVLWAAFFVLRIGTTASVPIRR